MRLMHSVALTSAFLLTSTGAAAEEPTTEVGQAYATCMLNAAGTADALEHWVDYCSRPPAVTLRTDADYVACLRDAAGAGTGRAPAGWVRGGKATAQAVVALRQAVALGVAGSQTRPLARLSRSEFAVAELVASGCTNREIGERLHIARRTVETHVAHAFQKLDIRTRAHLAAIVTASTR